MVTAATHGTRVMLAAATAVLIPQGTASIQRSNGVKVYRHRFHTLLRSHFSTWITAAAGGSHRSRRSLRESQQACQTEQQQIISQAQHVHAAPGLQQLQQPVQRDEAVITQSSTAVGESQGRDVERKGSTGQSQQQQQPSFSHLWETAARLGLKRGSEVPPHTSSSRVVEVDDTGLSSSSSSSIACAGSGGSSSRRGRRSRARSRTGSSSSSSTAAHSSSGSSTAPRPLDGKDIATTSTAPCAVATQSGTSVTAEDVPSAASSSASTSKHISRFGGSSAAVVAAVARLGRFLDFRERSSKEVLAKLETLGYEKATALQVLAALQGAGLQSDARFAEMYVRTYWKAKAQSPWRLAYELRCRGVAHQHIDAAISTVFGSSQQLQSREVLTEQEEEVWEHLVEVCRRQVELTSTEPNQKRKAKLYSWLQRRGHNNSTIFKVFAAVGL